MTKYFSGDLEAMAKGYVEMAEINLNISNEWFFVEEEGWRKANGLDSEKGENQA